MSGSNGGGSERTCSDEGRGHISVNTTHIGSSRKIALTSIITADTVLVSQQVPKGRGNQTYETGGISQ